MKEVMVKIEDVQLVVYTWTCPECGEELREHEYSGDRALQTIYCRKCRRPIFRQGPGGFYGTEKPG